MLQPWRFSLSVARAWEVEVLQLWRFSHSAAHAWEVEVLQPWRFSHSAAHAWEVEVVQPWRFSHSAARTWGVEALQPWRFTRCCIYGGLTIVPFMRGSSKCCNYGVSAIVPLTHGRSKCCNYGAFHNIAIYSAISTHLFSNVISPFKLFIYSHITLNTPLKKRSIISPIHMTSRIPVKAICVHPLRNFLYTYQVMTLYIVFANVLNNK